VLTSLSYFQKESCVRCFLFRNGLFGRNSVAVRVTEQACQITSFGECCRKCVRVINYSHACFVKHLESLIKLLYRIKIVDSTKWNLHLVLYFYMARQPLVGKGLLIFETSRSHTDTQHSVGLLWMADKPYAETPTWQRTTITRKTHSCPSGMRTLNPSKRAPQTHALDRATTGVGIRLYKYF